MGTVVHPMRQAALVNDPLAVGIIAGLVTFALNSVVTIIFTQRGRQAGYRMGTEAGYWHGRADALSGTEPPSLESNDIATSQRRALRAIGKMGRHGRT